MDLNRNVLENKTSDYIPLLTIEAYGNVLRSFLPQIEKYDSLIACNKEWFLLTITIKDGKVNFFLRTPDVDFGKIIKGDENIFFQKLNNIIPPNSKLLILRETITGKDGKVLYPKVENNPIYQNCLIQRNREEYKQIMKSLIMFVGYNTPGRGKNNLAAIAILFIAALAFGLPLLMNLFLISLGILIALAGMILTILNKAPVTALEEGKLVLLKDKGHELHKVEDITKIENRTIISLFLGSRGFYTITTSDNSKLYGVTSIGDTIRYKNQREEAIKYIEQNTLSHVKVENKGLVLSAIVEALLIVIILLFAL